MISLSWWEQFLVQAVISLLTVLRSRITNTTELAAIAAVIAFLERLLGGTVAIAS